MPRGLPSQLVTPATALEQGYSRAVRDLLMLAGPARQRVLVDASARFTAEVDLPQWTPVQSMPIELGGLYPNDLCLYAYVGLTDSGAWYRQMRRLASIRPHPWRTQAAFLARRTLDVSASDREDRPIVRLEEALLITLRSEDDTEWSVLVGDRAGIREVAAGGIDMARTRVNLRSTKRFAAFPEHVVGWDASTKALSYQRVEGLDDLPGGRGSSEPTGLISPRYAVLNLGPRSGQAPAPDTAMPDELGSEVPRLFGGLVRPPTEASPFLLPDGPVIGTPATVSGLYGGDVSTAPGGGTTHSGYGPESGAPTGYGGCIHYESSDNCKGCCTSTFSLIMSSIVGAAIACHTVSDAVPCAHFACGCVEGAASAVALVYYGDCQRNCERPVRW